MEPKEAYLLMSETFYDSNNNIYFAPNKLYKFFSKLGNENNIFDYTMYPNPANEILNVRMADNRIASYRVLNFLGQQVDSGKLSENGINVSKLNAGVYLFEVNDGQKTMTKKFIKK